MGSQTTQVMWIQLPAHPFPYFWCVWVCGVNTSVPWSVWRSENNLDVGPWLLPWVRQGLFAVFCLCTLPVRFLGFSCLCLPSPRSSRTADACSVWKDFAWICRCLFCRNGFYLSSRVLELQMLALRAWVVPGFLGLNQASVHGCQALFSTKPSPPPHFTSVLFINKLILWGLFPSLELGYLFHPAEAYAFLFPKLTEIRI